MSFDLATSTLTALNTIRLNPFRSGQCLSTMDDQINQKQQAGLNPFRSGQCLSTEIFEKVCEILESQSLSIRAMSFDGVNHGKD